MPASSAAERERKRKERERKERARKAKGRGLLGRGMAGGAADAILKRRQALKDI